MYIAIYAGTYILIYKAYGPSQVIFFTSQVNAFIIVLLDIAYLCFFSLMRRLIRACFYTLHCSDSE